MKLDTDRQLPELDTDLERKTADGVKQFSVQYGHAQL